MAETHKRGKKSSTKGDPHGPPQLAYGNRKVAKEAFEHKHGGAVGKHRLDRRASGGRVGADKAPLAASSSKHPFSSAHKGG